MSATRQVAAGRKPKRLFRSTAAPFSLLSRSDASKAGGHRLSVCCVL